MTNLPQMIARDGAALVVVLAAIGWVLGSFDLVVVVAVAFVNVTFLALCAGRVLRGLAHNDWSLGFVLAALGLASKPIVAFALYSLLVGRVAPHAVIAGVLIALGASCIRGLLLSAHDDESGYASGPRDASSVTVEP